MEHVIDNFYYNYGLAREVYGGWIFEVSKLERDAVGYDCYYFYGKYLVCIKEFDKAVEGLKYRVLAEEYEDASFYHIYEKMVEEEAEEEDEEEE